MLQISSRWPIFPSIPVRIILSYPVHFHRAHCYTLFSCTLWARQQQRPNLSRHQNPIVIPSLTTTLIEGYCIGFSVALAAGHAFPWYNYPQHGWALCSYWAFSYSWTYIICTTIVVGTPPTAVFVVLYKVGVSPAIVPYTTYSLTRQSAQPINTITKYLVEGSTKNRSYTDTLKLR